MSVIAYTAGQLVADRIGLYDLDGFPYVFEMCKLYLSPDKQFAFAYCGAQLHDRQIEGLTKAARIMLEKHIKEGSRNPLEVPKEWTHLFGVRSMVIMTRDQVFGRHKDVPTFYEVNLDYWTGSGTCVYAFRIAYQHLKIVRDAAAVAVKFTTGRESIIDCVSMEDLEPFVVTEKEKE